MQTLYLIDRGNCAASDLGKFGVNLWGRRPSNAPRRFRQLAINTKAALVDSGAQLPYRMLGLGQPREPIKQCAFCFNVLAAVAVKSLQAIIVAEPVNLVRLFDLPRTTRLAHLVHEPLAGRVFAVSEFEGLGCHTQPRRQAKCQRHTHCANTSIRRDLRPAKSRRH